MLGNYYNPSESEARPLSELNRYNKWTEDTFTLCTDFIYIARSLDNLPDVDSWPHDYDFRGFHFPDVPYDQFSATITTIYSVFVSILQDKERYSNLLCCRGHIAQQVLDIIQMVRHY